MSSNPKITVYITNFNYGCFIKDAIDSVLNQTEQNFEIIIIDDGSTDESKSIIQSYQDNSKIKIVLQNNRGLTVSNNIALKLARGKYIMRLDADDSLTLNSLEILSTTLDNKPNIGMIFGDYYIADKNNNVIEHFQRHNFSQDVKLLDQPAHGACTMFRVECLKQLGGYDETITRQDGFELWLRFIEKYDVTNVNLPIFYYRQHGKNLTTKEDQLLDTRTEILRKHAQRKKDGPAKGLAILPIRDDRDFPFAPIGDTFLIDKTIQFVLDFKHVSKVLLTTPSERVLDYVKTKWDNRITLIRRPKHISVINSPLEPVVHHSIENMPFKNNFDFFMLLGIETPFKKSQIIEAGINIMHIFDVKTVVGVRPERNLLLNHEGKGMKFFMEQSKYRLERNELYKMVPGYLVRDMDSFQKSGSLFGETIGHVVFDQLSAFRIENDLDCSIANYLSRNHS